MTDFAGTAANDFIHVAGDGRAVPAGFNEIALATDGSDTIDAGAGHDQVFAGAGIDFVHGGIGADDIDGGAGGDFLVGEDGDDHIVGAGDNDIIYGDNQDYPLDESAVGADTLDGDDGDDLIRGAGGRDTILGGAGFDRLRGEKGDDTITGGAGIDDITGDEGNDVIIITAPGDIASDGVSREKIDGGAHDGTGDPLTTGDRLDIRTSALVDLSQVDLIDIEKITSFGPLFAKTSQINGKLLLGSSSMLFTGAGNVDLSNGATKRFVSTPVFFLSGDGPNLLDLTGQKGANYTTHGGAATDTVFGATTRDVMDGAGGDDNLLGKEGDDDLTGGGGNDVLLGGDGFNTAHFSDVEANYSVTVDLGAYKVSHLGGAGADGVDTLDHIQVLTFADGSADPAWAAKAGGGDLTASRAPLVGSILGLLGATDPTYFGVPSAAQILGNGFDFGGGLSIGPSLFLTTGDGTPLLSNPGLVSVKVNSPGDADVTAAAAAAGKGPSFDASAFTFNFLVGDPTINYVSFDLIMGSEEALSTPDFGDLATVFVNGQNYALFNNSPTGILSLNQFFAPMIRNVPAPGSLPIQYDGVSRLLSVLAPVHQGQNTIKIAIADLGDREFDSGIFIGGAQLLSNGAPGLYVKIDGGAGADNLTGEAAPEFFRLGDGDDAVNGGAGNDLLQGQGGLDTLRGGAGFDTADFSDKAQSVVVFLNGGADSIVTVGGAAEDTLSEIENVNGGAGDDALVGDGFANALAGGLGRDFLFSSGFNPDGTLKAAAGNDTLNGDAGDDGLFAGDGNDALNGGLGNDGMVGGAGADTLDGGDGGDFLFGGFFTGAGGFAPGSGDDVLNGGAGNDGLWGFDGADTMKGGVGDDYGEGGDGNDTLDGGAGNDFLLGQNGDDAIGGGSGFDYEYGGAGADLFVFKRGDSFDWALDFNAAQGDKLRLEGFGFADFAAVPILDLSSGGNLAAQVTVFNPLDSSFDQITLFGVSAPQLNATNVQLG